jgi:HK97 family phage major capsid protein
MATPTQADVDRLKAKRSAILQTGETMLEGIRETRGNSATLTEAERTRLAAIRSDADDLETRIAEVSEDVARVGSLPEALQRRANGRPVRGGRTAGQISPLDPPQEELRRLFDAAQHGQSAAYERRFTSADSLLPPELFPQVTAQIHPARILNYLPGFSIELPSVEFVRHVSTTGAAGSVAEGGLKPEVTLVVDKLVLSAVKLSAHLALSREIYTDWDAFSQYALSELQRQVIDVENAELLAGDGTGTDMLGFYTTPGILTHDASADASPETVWDSIEKSIAQLRSGPALAEPDLAIFHPDDWSSIRRIKDAYQRYLVSPDPSRDEVNQCWGIPVLTTVQNPIGQGLLIDTSKFGRVAIRQPLAMFTGFANDDLIRNLYRWVAETRLVLCVERPAAVCSITKLPAPTATETKSSAKK